LSSTWWNKEAMKWRPSHIAATYALLIVALTTLYPSDAVKSLEKYGMYVWKDGEKKIIA